MTPPAWIARKEVSKRMLNTLYRAEDQPPPQDWSRYRPEPPKYKPAIAPDLAAAELFLRALDGKAERRVVMAIELQERTAGRSGS